MPPIWAAFLQGKILFVILIKIRSFGLRRNALIRLVLELTALDVGADNTAFGAKDSFLVELCAEGTIQAGPLDLFPKKHAASLVSSGI